MVINAQFRTSILIGLTLAFVVKLAPANAQPSNPLSNLFLNAISKARSAPSTDKQTNTSPQAQVAPNIANPQDPSKAEYFKFLASIQSDPRWSKAIVDCYTGYGNRMTAALKRYLPELIEKAESKQVQTQIEAVLAGLDRVNPSLYKTVCVHQAWLGIWSSYDERGVGTLGNGQFLPHPGPMTRQGPSGTVYPIDAIKAYMNDLTDKAWQTRMQAFHNSISSTSAFDPTELYSNCFNALATCDKETLNNANQAVTNRYNGLIQTYLSQFDPNSTSRMEAMAIEPTNDFGTNLYFAVNSNSN